MPIDLVAVERHLVSNDAVSVLLRGHLWVETALTDLISVGLEYPEHWQELQRLSFPSKVGLARAQGELPWPGALIELNRTRNKVGHDPRFEVDHSAALHLAASFEPDFGHLEEAGDMGASPELRGDETPADIVRACVLVLITHLLVLTTEALQAQTNTVTEQRRRAREMLVAREADD